MLIKIKQIKSTINRPFFQKRIIKVLGLGKINKSVKVSKSLQIEGMIKKVKHLIKIELL